MGMNETCVKSIDSEQFLNGNEWDREGHGKNGIALFLVETLQLLTIADAKFFKEV